jgi:ribosomal protein S18 acetylase RimI-like enzyme
MTVQLSNLIQLASDPFDRPALDTVRHTMQMRLEWVIPPGLPRHGYRFMPWNDFFKRPAARALRNSFLNSPELDLYPALASTSGCAMIVEELTRMPGFLPQASGLILRRHEPIGVIIANRAHGCVFGEIQLLAVAPGHRRRGLATYMVNHALWCFHDSRLWYATVRLSESSRLATRLFTKLGFQVAASTRYQRARR